MKKYDIESAMNLVSKLEKRKMQKPTRKQVEANARRKVVKAWARLANGTKYQTAAVKDVCDRTTLQMEEELFDGILLNLRDKNNVKSYSAQKRILRRIVEKRQAQRTHGKISRTEDCFSRHISRYCVSKIMNNLKSYQMCS